MKPRIKPQAILDLLRHIDRTTAFKKALLESALEHLDVLEDGDEEAFVEVVPTTYQTGTVNVSQPRANVVSYCTRPIPTTAQGTVMESTGQA